MLIFLFIVCVIIIGSILGQRMLHNRKDRLEKKKAMEERLKKLIFTNKQP